MKSFLDAPLSLYVYLYLHRHLNIPSPLPRSSDSSTFVDSSTSRSGDSSHWHFVPVVCVRLHTLTNSSLLEYAQSTDKQSARLKSSACLFWLTFWTPPPMATGLQSRRSLQLAAAFGSSQRRRRLRRTRIRRRPPHGANTTQTCRRRRSRCRQQRPTFFIFPKLNSTPP